MKITKIIMSILIFLIIYVSCTALGDPVNNSLHDNAESSPPKRSIEENYITVGEIIYFDKDRVHILRGDTIEIFNVSKESFTNFYLGEIVAVFEMDENIYDLRKFLVSDFSAQYTTMGMPIYHIKGFIKSTDGKKIVIKTIEDEITINTYTEIHLPKGMNVIADYINFDGENELVDIYNENSKLTLTITKIKRVENTGAMILSTKDENGMEYEVSVSEAIVNFNYSELEKGVKITVYYDKIRESYPIQVDAKMIFR
ncbi:MAG: hypothetical protein KAX49_03195 [Halanaerobiales bacterium]|nr:hypothetical protein [Halanaerobiales bacterium]